MVTNDKFLVGAAAGLGLAVAGYVIYKKNQDKIDSFLRDQGLNIPVAAGSGYEDMTLEDLMLNKERLEDLIAEKEAEDR